MTVTVYMAAETEHQMFVCTSWPINAWSHMFLVTCDETGDRPEKGGFWEGESAASLDAGGHVSRWKELRSPQSPAPNVRRLCDSEVTWGGSVSHWCFTHTWHLSALTASLFWGHLSHNNCQRNSLTTVWGSLIVFCPGAFSFWEMNSTAVF